jgi:RNA 3'-terminal phosphate cyclase (ATP)
MIEIDGSKGEGGGQIVRTAVGLSLVRGKPVAIHKIRANRRKPGLGHQHCTAIAAAAAIGGARVIGNHVGSRELVFEPGATRPGTYVFQVGTAGSATLVLQTILPALLLAPLTTTVAIEGGTHNPLAPPFEFIERAFLPIVARLGPRVQARLERHGFYPKGEGRIAVEVHPVPALSPLELPARGRLLKIAVRALVARLPRHIAEREVRTVETVLRDQGPTAAEVVELTDAPSPGNVLAVEVVSEHVTEVFTAIGERGVPAETVAQTAANEARNYLLSGAPVGPRLADQLVIPLALAGGGFATTALTSHTTTNIDVVRQVLGVELKTAPHGRAWQITFAPRAS